MSQSSNDAYVEVLLTEARECENLSEQVIEKRRRLYELTTLHPAKVIEYFDSQPQPIGAGERLLRAKLLKIAAAAIFEKAARG